MTPLQMAVMYAALANGGRLMEPKVARAIVAPSGEIIERMEPKQVGKLPVSNSTLKFLQNSLRAVVTSGTARGAFAGLRAEVSGKTGTGQVFGRNLDGSAKDDTSWFASYAPAKNPKYVVVMMVSQGGFGASTSGIGVRRIYEHIYGEGGKKAIDANVSPMRVPTIRTEEVVRQ